MTAHSLSKHPHRTTFIVIILCLLFFGPLLLAWYLFHYPPAWLKSTTNYGQLIQPPFSLDAFTLKYPDGAHITSKAYQGKWLMLYISPSPCAALCQNNLYKMRQVRLALGKDSERVQRLLVLLTKPQPQATVVSRKNLLDKRLAALLANDYQGTQAGFLQYEPWLKQVAPLVNKSLTSNIAIEQGSLYLVDPLGNVILVYPADAALRGLYNDLIRLLKVSSIG